MASLDFVDEVKLYLRAGHGGAGALHFRREKFVPKGGPDGGDGGKGGDIIIQGNKQLSTLLHLTYKKHIVAESGQPGQGGCRTGADGRCKVIAVPLGTIVKNRDTGVTLLDITQDGQEHIIMHGGKGGQGNVHFKSATQQTPRYAQSGQAGEESWVQLELKLLAQVGLVGLPNAGKSTLLAAISAAKPKIAPYPFTTLIPQLGVVPYREGQSFVMADIPGIIEGAAHGKGLGLQFLRHIERTACLVFIIAADMPNCYQTYTMLRDELAVYQIDMLHKTQLVVISKADLLDAEEQATIKATFPNATEPMFISAVTGQGLLAFKDRVWKSLHR